MKRCPQIFPQGGVEIVSNKSRVSSSEAAVIEVESGDWSFLSGNRILAPPELET
jgi:hypothetical protein